MFLRQAIFIFSVSFSYFLLGRASLSIIIFSPLSASDPPPPSTITISPSSTHILTTEPELSFNPHIFLASTHQTRTETPHSLLTQVRVKSQPELPLPDLSHPSDKQQKPPIVEPQLRSIRSDASRSTQFLPSL